MVEYQPPDRVVVMVGASFRADPLLAATDRVATLAERDQAQLARLGLPADLAEKLRRLRGEVASALKDKALAKNDTPLQMGELAATMAQARSWLVELRELAVLNLSLDTPALEAVVSAAPEVSDGYARDLLVELRRRVRAATELKPRLDDVGLDDAFIRRGQKLVKQLETALGAEDIKPENLPFKLRRLYTRKGQLFLLLQRTTRAGRHVFRAEPRRAAAYHLHELESAGANPSRA